MPPKQFTDEELKQQYGIHLATRLQSDENGKESKWADLDDDEDDWVPETVVWMDGTKSTVNTQEPPPPAKEQQPAPPPAKTAEGVKPALAMKKPTELGPQKTILKPGANTAAAQAKQISTEGLADKTSLKAKSPAPTPAKSPWAALPPVDKVSPINPPVQQPQTPAPPVMATQDARAYDSLPPVQPAREIAVDTFDRSWREGVGTRRELFNSASGRYEPAPEKRRGSKPELMSRKPAVLQRPSQNGPVEPSPLLNSRAQHVLDGPWDSRRRSSINQRPTAAKRPASISKPEEAPALRRTSSSRPQSPSTADGEAARPVFAQQSAWSQQMPARPTDQAKESVMEDPIKVQERVMREKRELAKKRREEDDKRLEEEKQERLRLRLASLEGAGKSRKEREAEAARANPAKTVMSREPVSDAAHQAPSAASVQSHSKTQPAQPAKPANSTIATDTAAFSKAAVESRQIASGLAQPQKSETGEKSSSAAPQPQSTEPADNSSKAVSEGQLQQHRTQQSGRDNARAPFQHQTSAYKNPSPTYPSPGDRKQQHLNRAVPPAGDVLSPWPTTAPHSNVWSTSGIGNGLFESASSFAPMPMSQQSSSLPPPPGMSGIARPSTSTRISPQDMSQGSRSPSHQQPAAPESDRRCAPSGLESSCPDPFINQGHVSRTSPGPGLGRQAHLPAPIGPPSRAQQSQPHRPDALAGWQSAAERLSTQYRGESSAAERSKDVPATSDSTSHKHNKIKEVFKQTAAKQGKLGAPRKYGKTEYTVHDDQGTRTVSSHSPVSLGSQVLPSRSTSTTMPPQQEVRSGVGEHTGRIPDELSAAHGGSMALQAPIAPPSQQQLASINRSGLHFATGPLPPLQSATDQSPPPPEMLDHPANFGNAFHPLVRLPFSKPIVRLPSAPGPSHSPALQASQGGIAPRQVSQCGPPGTARPFVMQEAWQARFNGLFNRTPIQTETPPSPPKTPPKEMAAILPVACSSEMGLFELETDTGAIVSLPLSIQTGKAMSSGAIIVGNITESVSKPAFESAFEEERGFGSRPKTSIPRNPVYRREFYEPLPRNHLTEGNHPKPLRPIDPRNRLELNLPEVHPKDKDGGILVQMPQLNLQKLILGVKRQPYYERKASARFGGRTAKNNGSTTNESENKRLSLSKTADDPKAKGSPGNDGRKKSASSKPPKNGQRRSTPIKVAQ